VCEFLAPHKPCARLGQQKDIDATTSPSLWVLCRRGAPGTRHRLGLSRRAKPLINHEQQESTAFAYAAPALIQELDTKYPFPPPVPPSPPHLGGVLHLTTGMLRSFDPTAGYTTELALVWDTLLEWESTWYFPEAQTKPMTRKSLVESWEMVDPLTWIFHLRKGVKFHNVPPVHGREMVAEDVRYSYELPPPPRRRVCQSVYNRHLMRLNQSLTLAAACTRGLHQSQSGLLLAVCSLATVSRCDRAHAGLRALPHAQRGSGSERPQSGWLRSAASQPVPGRTGASAGLRPACGRQGARPAAWRGLGEVSGGAGGDGHALGERTSGRAAGGHAGDGRGQWQRPFEFPILHTALAACVRRSSPQRL
jgi:hypothetical protein